MAQEAPSVRPTGSEDCDDDPSQSDSDWGSDSEWYDSEEENGLDDCMSDIDFETRCRTDIYWFAVRTVPGFGKSLKELMENDLNIPPTPCEDDSRCNR